MKRRILGAAMMAGLVPAWAAGQVPYQAYPNDPVPISQQPSSPVVAARTNWPTQESAVQYPIVPVSPHDSMFPSHQTPLFQNQPVTSVPANPYCGSWDCAEYPLGGPEYVSFPFLGGWNVFTHLGYKALERQGLGSGAVAAFDPTGVDDGLYPSSLTSNQFTQIRPDVTARYSDISHSMHHGFEAAVGVYNDFSMWEIAGYYIPEQSDYFLLTDPGNVTSFFFNPALGFEGNSGLWDNADEIHLAFRTTLGNVEINHRMCSPWHPEIQLLCGARYVDLQEFLAITTDDDGQTVGPNPVLVATYNSRTHNRLMGGQFGMAGRQPVLKHLDLMWEVRGGWFANQISADYSQIRGDGRVGRAIHIKTTRFSHLYEMGLFIEFHQKSFRIKAGYNALFVLNVAEAVDQVNFNLARTRGRDDYTGNIFYHGPSAHVEFTF